MNYTIDRLARAIRDKSLGKKEFINLLIHRDADHGKAEWNKLDAMVTHAVQHGMTNGETEGHKSKSRPSYGCASKHRVGLTGTPKEGSALFKALEKVREQVRDGFMRSRLEKQTISESGLYFHEWTQCAKEMYCIPLSFRKERDGNLVFTAESLMEYGIAWDMEVTEGRKAAEKHANTKRGKLERMAKTDGPEGETARQKLAEMDAAEMAA